MTESPIEYLERLFDEMDKLPLGLIDTIKPYIEIDPHFKDFNPRHGIFIFLRYLERFYFLYLHLYQFF